ILETTKKDIKIRVESLHSNHVMQPHLIFLLPLLKKEALEEAVYSLCEIGVNEIQLVATAKSKALSAVTSKELDRLRAIIIAAAEQSKNYTLSTLLEPKKLQDVISSFSQASQKIVFDVSGKSFFQIHKTTEKNIILSVGPEGGFTNEELTFLQSHGFESCALTHTTLRAVQAVAISSGLFRLL
ncbi:MAG TPA: RsmE family RNA methyltransferase, partial [Candidatus Saccharimonadales bacterium]|nr:RsmE family RNA methyltransferase [Candidatus Saccharimonadales bacterium]